MLLSRFAISLCSSDKLLCSNSLFSTSEREPTPLAMAAARHPRSYAFGLFVRISDFTCLSSLFSKSYLWLLVPLGFLYTLQFGFLLLNNEVVPFEMLFTCNSFCLPTFHQKVLKPRVCMVAISSSLSFWLFPVSWLASNRKRYERDNSA